MYMKNRIYCLLIIFAFSYSLQAQLNKYKYIVVPKNFVGFKYENQYKTSTLIKYLFQQKGFDVVYDDSLPEDLYSNRCLGLLVQLNHKSTMFATYASLTLKDCNDKDVFVTAEGKSKSKDNTIGYKEAINYAFNSFNNVSYNYIPEATVSTVRSTPMVVKEEVKESEAIKVAEEKKDIETPVVNTGEVNSEAVTQSSAATVAVVTEVAASKASTLTKTASPEVWYAQEIPNGYQLVDSTPKIRLKVYKTSVPDIYIGINEEAQGLVYFKNSKWYFEYYVADKLLIEELAIKF